METHAENHMQLDGELIAELLDQDEYPSNVGEVAAISDKQICLLRRDWHELIHYRLDYLDVGECRAIEYRKDTAYYRLVAGGAFLIAAVVLVFMLVSDVDNFATEGAPLILAVVVLVSVGTRFVTSTHRHIIYFEMLDETLVWKSPAIDFASKADAAHAVREYARNRGILRAVEG